VHDVIDTQDSIYMIYDFCNGDNLSTLLKARGRFTEEEARHIINLIAMIKLDVAHRDLQQGNIFCHFKD